MNRRIQSFLHCFSLDLIAERMRRLRTRPISSRLIGLAINPSIKLFFIGIFFYSFASFFKTVRTIKTVKFFTFFLFHRVHFKHWKLSIFKKFGKFLYFSLTAKTLTWLSTKPAASDTLWGWKERHEVWPMREPMNPSWHWIVLIWAPSRPWIEIYWPAL